jgi:hypothetical protein
MFEKPTPAEIIGVVGNVRYDSLVTNHHRRSISHILISLTHL